MENSFFGIDFSNYLGVVNNGKSWVATQDCWVNLTGSYNYSRGVVKINDVTVSEWNGQWNGTLYLKLPYIPVKKGQTVSVDGSGNITANLYGVLR